MIKDALGYKFHWAVADYLQRAARHLASKSDVEQAYALGKAAVELAIAGHNSIMPTVVRKSTEPYVWEIGHAPLSEVANVEKFMPKDFISADGYGITDKCRDYLYPLIQGEDYPPFEKGMPKYVTLKNAPVERKLPPFEL
jgi:6-phosphofructokinase 1